jgi:hypothetical protein
MTKAEFLRDLTATCHPLLGNGNRKRANYFLFEDPDIEGAVRGVAISSGSIEPFVLIQPPPRSRSRVTVLL